MEHQNCRSSSTAVINQDLIQSCEMPRLINLCQHFLFHRRLLSLPASPLPPRSSGQSSRLQAGGMAMRGPSQAPPKEISMGLNQACPPALCQNPWMWWLHPSATPGQGHRCSPVMMKNTFEHFPNMAETPSNPGLSPHIALSNRIQHHCIKNPCPLKWGVMGLFFTGKPNAGCHLKIKMDLIENPDASSEPHFPGGKKLLN